MPDITTEAERSPANGWRRVGWFVVLWSGSLMAWLAFAYFLKWVMGLVGIAA